MQRTYFYASLYAFFFLVGACLGATTASPSFATLPNNSAPAAAPLVRVDTLPQGRYQVSSFNNGRSTEFIVENGEIQMLKIDGKDVPNEQFPEHQDMVENMIGGRSGNGTSEMHFDVFRDLRGFETQAERMQEYFEERGEEWERMGEEMGRRFEEMFEFDEENGSFRFEWDGGDGEVFEFNLDSLMTGREYRLLPDGSYEGRDFEGRSYDDIIREKELDLDDAERELDELETMIERMERRKEEVRERVRQEERSSGFSYNGFNFQQELIDLRREGLIAPGVIRSFELNQKSLKVNGTKVDDDVHERIIRRYREKVNVGRKFSIELDGLDW